MGSLETVISFGGSVKALGEAGEVGGYIVRFSSEKDPDLLGDFFTRETDFDMDFPGKSSVYYEHGLDPTIGKRKLGTVSLERDDVGIWAEGQLAIRDQYEGIIFKMLKSGKLGWSSGTAKHLVEQEKVGRACKMLAWPLGLDASLTPKPVEPRNQAVISVKSYLAEIGLQTDDEDELLDDAIKSEHLTVDDPRTLERLLRDAGLSNRAAKAIVADGYKGLARCDAGERVSERDRLQLELIRTQAQKRQRITLSCQKGLQP